MRAVIMLFDTLSRRFLNSYGCTRMQTANFTRLEKHCTVFDRHYVGSMPCMPARRELQTGCYNFLYRSWGPVEPFDYSICEDLKRHGIYTHICTDHSHYWEDGGATYLQRFNSWEGFRGQEGDRWQPCPDHSRIKVPELLPSSKQSESLWYNYASRAKIHSEDDFSSVQTIRAGAQYLEKYHDIDNWLLQIECFDPHEPFNVPDHYLKMVGDTYQGLKFDWPKYGIVTETEEEKEHLIRQYAALICMCDYHLGEILDLFDQYHLWQDTMLIVATDHGFLTAEHNLWGKDFGPQYEETSHIPLYLHVPGLSQPRRTASLTQTIDIPATIAEYFGLPENPQMQGRSLIQLLKQTNSQQRNLIYGVHGSYIHLVSGDYIYMCAPKENSPYYEYTMMPTHMRGFFSQKNLQKAELTDYPGTDIKVLKVPSDAIDGSSPGLNPQDLLFNMKEDPGQQHSINDQDLLRHMRQVLKEELQLQHVDQQFLKRYGLV